MIKNSVGVVIFLMSKGFPFALSSGALWGLLLVAPAWLSDFSATDITFGRFLLFGMLVLMIFLYRQDSFRHLRAEDFRHYLILSLFGNVLFYLALIASMDYLDMVPACLLVGALPVFGWNSLGFASQQPKRSGLIIVLLALAMLMVIVAGNGEMPVEENSWQMGSLLLLSAGVCWLLAARIQSRFIRYRREIDHSDHFILSGIMVLPSIVLLLPFMMINDPVFALMQDDASDDRRQQFWIIMVVIAFMSTLIARLFWRNYTRRAVLSEMHWHGMWKSVFGLFYAYLFEQRLPEGMELAGLLCFAAGLFLYGRQRSKDQCLQA